MESQKGAFNISCRTKCTLERINKSRKKMNITDEMHRDIIYSIIRDKKENEVMKELSKKYKMQYDEYISDINMLALDLTLYADIIKKITKPVEEAYEEFERDFGLTKKELYAY